MTFYTDMAATSTSLLTTYGQTITLRRVSGGTFDPAAGTLTGETTTDITCVGLFLNRTESLLKSFGAVENEDRFLVLDSTQVPDTTDLLLIGSETWTIVEVMAVNPAGTPVVYFVRVQG